MAEMQAYKLISGIHYEKNPDFKGKSLLHPDSTVRYSATDGPNIVMSERELDKVFVNKFEKVVPGQNAPAVPVSEDRRSAVARLIGAGWEEKDRALLESLPEEFFQRITQPHSPVEASKKVVSMLGEDVTDLFQRAYDEGFRVFRNATGKHQVTRGGGTGKPLNPKPLEAQDVDSFVGKYLETAK